MFEEAGLQDRSNSEPGWQEPAETPSRGSSAGPSSLGFPVPRGLPWLRGHCGLFYEVQLMIMKSLAPSTLGA